jgi:tetratricopeptide (TPR) repeat protein
MERRDPAAAEASMRRIIEFHRRSPGSKNPLLAAALARLGYILRTTDRAGEAEKVLRESLDIHRALNDPHDNDISFTLNELALAIGSRGQPAEAEKLQREAIARAPEDDREVLIYRARLARWIALQQRFEEAEKQLQDVVPELQRTFGPNASNTAEAISILADVYDAWGKPDQAAEWRAKLKAILSATQPATQSTTQPATSPG